MQVVMLHKKLDEKIAGIGYYDEFGPGTLVEGPTIIPHLVANVKKNFFVKLHKKNDTP